MPCDACARHENIYRRGREERKGLMMLRTRVGLSSLETRGTAFQEGAASLDEVGAVEVREREILLLRGQVFQGRVLQDDLHDLLVAALRQRRERRTISRAKP